MIPFSQFPVMEVVLALQTLQAGGTPVPTTCVNTNGCVTDACETLGATNVCSTTACAYGNSNAAAASLGAQ